MQCDATSNINDNAHLISYSAINCTEHIECAKTRERLGLKLTLSTGAIRGRKVVTGKNTTAYVFHGIPYAELPIGDLRYRAPID